MPPIPSATLPQDPIHDVFAGGGEMGARMRAMDWGLTPLGEPGLWPQNLKTCLRIILTSRQPMFVWWGDRLINLYNDAYKSIVGGKHPQALGQPASEVWKEIWDQVGPRAKATMGGTEGTYDEALLLIMQRHGYPEETYYTFSYSPVPGDLGGAGGIFCANSDETQRIIGARRMSLLRDLASRTTSARTLNDVCARSVESFATETRDLPFAMVYMAAPDGESAILAGASGIRDGHPAARAVASLTVGSSWPFAQALRDRTFQRLADAGARFGAEALPGGAWDRPPQEMVAVPIAPAGRTGRAGLLIVGLNPYRPWDEDYRSFLELIAAQISSSIASAQAYEEERKRAEALAELDRAKTAFFSNVSHEFRTPLTLMLGPLEDSLNDPIHPLADGQRERQELIHRNGLRLLKLVNNLLEFSRIEAGRIETAFTATDLAAYTAELASVFRSAMGKGGLEFRVDCPPLSRPVHVDRDMWEKIVLNLLSNALKFTFAGGISVSLRESGDQVELKVSDTGVGIPEEELPRVFTRFHRVQGAQSRTHEGSGIGLALVQELAKLHGGYVRVESAVGRGTAFTVAIPMGMLHLPADRVRPAATLRSQGSEATSFFQEAAGLLSDRDDPVPADAVRAEVAKDPARILLAEDNRDMRDYVARILEENWKVEPVANGAEALASALACPPALILSDVMMPDMDGFRLLKALREDARTAGIPSILLSARAGEEATVEGLISGADDYLVKPFSSRELLARVGARLEIDGLRRQKDSQARMDAERLRASEAFNRTIIANSPDCIKVIDSDGRLCSMNEGGMELLEICDFEPFRNRDYVSMWREPYRREAVAAFATARETGTGRFQGEFPTVVTGTPKWFDIIVTCISDADGRPERFLAVSRDITAMRDAEREIHKFQSLVEESSDFIGIGDLQGAPMYINAAGRRLVGLDAFSALAGLKGEDFYFPEDLASLAPITEAVSRDGNWEGELRLRHFRSGAAIPVWLNVFILKDRQSGQPFAMATVTRDLSQLKETEAHLRQAQKMEAIGKLAGGIAHDFNNLLTAINGYADLALGMPQVTDELREFLQEIRKSGERAALLTSQLLAYSRKQILAPKIIDLNGVLSEMDNMLRRLIGEDIELVSLPAPDLGRIKADPGQIQQVILNLTLNSRDAMPDGGRISLETANVILDDSYVASHLENRPGPYVMLAVKDTGSGMAEDVMARIFEPFFTTKSVGKGTGLGLSSVYGIVKQSGGAIAVESAPGEGSVFRVYLPMTEPEIQAPADQASAKADGQRKETLLLVEDEDSVRGFIRRTLELRGYRVLEARDGVEALKVSEDFGDEIHLLLTDMVMPRMGGSRLSEGFRRLRPRAKVLYMSGYTEKDIVHQGVLDEDTEYLQKPFRPEQLGTKISEILKRP
ncbi:MAG: chemotaxis protein CheY [Fibrobacteres bacterium]|nr:chemotaxis protein CheY [Fibrobacterota bacterium]